MSGIQYSWYKGYMQDLLSDAYDKEKASKEKMWKNAGKNEGLQIWRIQNMRVTAWPKPDYGKFYDGDSYIILKTGGQKYDVHTWIGKYSTEDEFTTATFKMIQLCTYLDGRPTQHREAQERESKLFKSYFNEFTYLHGGAPSSLDEIEAEIHKFRLFHFHGQRLKATVKEIPMDPNKIDDTDVYILDKNTEIIQWNGRGCNNGEKASAMVYVQKLKSERSGKSVRVEVVDQDPSGDKNDEFFETMKVCSIHIEEHKELELKKLKEENEEAEVTTVEKEDKKAVKNEGKKEEEEFDYSSDMVDYDPKDTTHELYRLSDVSGEMEFTQVKTGDDIELYDFDEQDVYIFDTKKVLFVWIGHSASQEERNKAMFYAQKYLSNTDHPIIPITCLRQGEETAEFKSFLKTW